MTANGIPTLGYQAKRVVIFSPSDVVFKDAVERLARAVPNLDLSRQWHRFAARAWRPSFKIANLNQTHFVGRVMSDRHHSSWVGSNERMPALTR